MEGTGLLSLHSHVNQRISIVACRPCSRPAGTGWAGGGGLAFNNEQRRFHHWCLLGR